MTPLRSLTAVLSCLFAISIAPGQALPERSPRNSVYEIEVDLDPEERLLVGKQLISWTNTTGSPTQELRFHLYINAFKNVSSTFMREADAEFRDQWRSHEFGWVRLDKIELVAGETRTDLTDRQSHIQPDDGNPEDSTVLLVTLPAPVAAGEAITIATEFRTKLPKAYRRTGYVPSDGFYCMQWYPKLGVLEQRDGEAVWNCHQFHANSEFFADFSVYEVAITVPEDYVVGATGQLQPGSGGNPPREGRKTLTFKQADVHDFAWVADPDFIRHEEVFGPIDPSKDEVVTAVASQLGVDPSEFALPRTKITLLLRPEHDTAGQVRRHIEAVKCALEFFGLRYGPYPYENITVVDPGRDAMGRRLAGGMEYPTLITCGTPLFPHPRQNSPEGVTVHEFGHQYWYGLSANNEFEESWLDEGINTYSEGRAQWLHYGRKMWPTQTSDFGVVTVAATPGLMADAAVLPGPLSFPVERMPRVVRSRLRDVGFSGLVIPSSPLLDVVSSQPTATFFREASFSDAWNDRRRWLDSKTPDAMVRNGWDYISRDSYGANSYTRPATLLRTLERMVGIEKWWTFMRRFHAQARFQHPTTDDFIRLLGEVCGSPAAAFFETAIKADSAFDYGVESVSPPNGVGTTKSVVVRRYGAMLADVQVRFRFEGRADPVYRRMPASATYPWKRFKFKDPVDGEPFGRLLEVWVDPPGSRPGTTESFEFDGRPGAGVFLIDQNMLNNAWRADRDVGPALYRGIRLLLQSQSQFSFAGLIG